MRTTEKSCAVVMKRQNTTIVSTLIFASCILVLSLGSSGCATIERTIGRFVPSGRPNYAQISQGYPQIKLKTSGAADVLAVIELSEDELLSQSKRVIVSSGQKGKKHYKAWFKMIAFDEDDLMAKRKYVFFVEEKPSIILAGPWEGIEFDCEIVLGSRVLDEPYADRNAKRIAILKNILENFRDDIVEVEADNKTLATSGMMVNQALEAALVKLNSSPALAAQLSEEAGVEFSHISLNKGKIQMVVAGDVAKVKIKAGFFMRKFKSDNLKTMTLQTPATNYH